MKGVGFTECTYCNIYGKAVKRGLTYVIFSALAITQGEPIGCRDPVSHAPDLKKDIS